MEKNNLENEVDFFSEGGVYRLNYNEIGQSRIGDETKKYRPATALGDTAWSTELQTVLLAPITGKYYSSSNSSKKKRKIGFGCTEVLAGTASLTKDSLILNAQIDALGEPELNSLKNSGNLKLSNKALPSSVITISKARLRTLLVSSKNLNRDMFHIGHYDLRTGDVLNIHEPKSGHNGSWVIVSSSVWLELLSASYILKQQDKKLPKGLAGLVRGVIAVVPLLDHKAPADELVVEIPYSQPGLPKGGHCRSHIIRTQSLDRINRNEGAIDNVILEDIIEVIEGFIHGH